MATITDTDAARIILDLVKDRTVTTAAPYANVDKVSAPMALKYGQAIWTAYHDPLPPGQTPTNDQLAEFFLFLIRKLVKEAYVRAEGRTAGQAAHQTAAATASGTADTDLGI